MANDNPLPERKFNPTQVAWTIRDFCADTRLSQSYIYELLSLGAIPSAKIGGRRLITISPREFITSRASGVAGD
jgi:hypothetical protein